MPPRIGAILGGTAEGKMETVCRRQLCKKLESGGIKTPRYLRCERSFSIYFPRAAKPVKRPVKHHKPQPEYKPSNAQSRLTSPPPPSTQKGNVLKYRTIPIILCGGVVLIASSYIAFYGTQIYNASSDGVPIEPAAQEDVSSAYNTLAKTFDVTIDSTEWWMGLPRKRKQLVSQAHGDVLEVSIGTGRNLEYYDWDFRLGRGGMKAVKKDRGGKVRSFTAIDKSGEMLEVAHEKFSSLFPGILGGRWAIGDASEAIPAPPKNSNERGGNLEGKKYDTIVQTMGLCSVKDPVRLLRNLGNNVVEEDGRILLLEHGRGTWDWLNRFLDSGAVKHAKDFGCWWNRDLGKIVEESGLEAVKVERWHGGTTWRMELKKPKTSPDVALKDVKTIAMIDGNDQKEDSKSRTRAQGWW